MFKWLKQLVCNHQLQGDRQITLVRCTKCQKEYWYEKGVDLFPPFNPQPHWKISHPSPISGGKRTQTGQNTPNNRPISTPSPLNIMR